MTGVCSYTTTFRADTNTSARSCYYPVPDAKFDLEAYLGTWYQVAGTPFGPTAGARCISANYSLNVRFSAPEISNILLMR